MADENDARSRDGSEPAALSGCLVRLGWMVVGNLVLLTVAVEIVREPQWTLTIKDALFWGVVAGLIVLRYVDVARLGGRTVNDEPATPRHLKRYASILLASSTALWLFAQSVNYIG
jgi:hypothetical protein